MLTDIIAPYEYMKSDRSDTMYVREATVSDGHELRQNMERTPQRVTGFAFTVVNVPDFFARARLYVQATVFVVEAHGRIAGPEYLATLLRSVTNHALDQGVAHVGLLSEPGQPTSKALAGFAQVVAPVRFYLKPLHPDAAMGERPLFVDMLDISPWLRTVQAGATMPH